MKLKYYLRGLGIGIVVTTLILMISYNIGGRMSDEEVIRRAKELGMVMTTEGSDDLFNNKPKETDPQNEQQTTTENAATEEITTETPTTEEPTTEESTTEPPTTEPPTTESVVELKIYIDKGTSSQAVSKMLYDGGVIDDAKEFNDYMRQCGYTGIIQRGTYVFDSSMTYEEIAKILVHFEENG